MEINKDLIVKCLDILPEDYMDSLGHALVLVATIVDTGEVVEGRDKKRVEVEVGMDTLDQGYRVIIEGLGT